MCTDMHADMCTEMRIDVRLALHQLDDARHAVLVCPLVEIVPRVKQFIDIPHLDRQYMQTCV